MFSRKYLFADIVIEFLSDRPVQSGELFGEFYTDRQADLTIKVISSPLPEKRGERIYKRRTRELLVNEKGSFLFSSYYAPQTGEELYIDYACLAHINGERTLYVDYAEGLWDSMVLDAVDIPSILDEYGMVMAHASAVLYNGEILLFTAARQVGKSTQADLWRKYRNAVIVNGDKMILTEKDGEFYACGSPYAGSSKISRNLRGKIRGIAALEQAPVNTAEPMKGAEAVAFLLDQTYFNREIPREYEKAFDFICRLADSVPVYKLRCRPDSGAVDVMEEALWKK